MEEMIVHKTKIGKDDDPSFYGTLCGQEGFRIILSSRVTCPKCKEIMANMERSHKGKG